METEISLPPLSVTCSILVVAVWKPTCLRCYAVMVSVLSSPSLSLTHNVSLLVLEVINISSWNVTPQVLTCFSYLHSCLACVNVE